jgi:hypothetical protein
MDLFACEKEKLHNQAFSPPFPFSPLKGPSRGKMPKPLCALVLEDLKT